MEYVLWIFVLGGWFTPDEIHNTMENPVPLFMCELGKGLVEGGFIEEGMSTEDFKLECLPLGVKPKWAKE